MQERLAASLGPRTILVADDDEDFRTLVAAELRESGFVVREAIDGAQLLAQLEEFLSEPDTSPDVVVADIMMPRLSGP
jgi:CheY-like chemotaxis protein